MHGQTGIWRDHWTFVTELVASSLSHLVKDTTVLSVEVLLPRDTNVSKVCGGRVFGCLGFTTVLRASTTGLLDTAISLHLN